MPVLLPMPKARMNFSSAALPSLRSSMIVPMLLECAMIPVTVHWMGAWSCASCTTTSPAWMCPGTVSTVSGVAMPFSSTPDRVTAFMIDPGSKTSETAGLPSRFGSVLE